MNRSTRFLFPATLSCVNIPMKSPLMFPLWVQQDIQLVIRSINECRYESFTS